MSNDFYESFKIMESLDITERADFVREKITNLSKKKFPVEYIKSNNEIVSQEERLHLNRIFDKSLCEFLLGDYGTFKLGEEK